MADEIAVSLQNMSKKFKLFASPGDRFKEALNPSGRTYHKEFWALRDINLEIPRGTTLGILGMNGAGKSTLLHLISGIQQPTTGSIQVEGRVSTLELGAGFNPEFSGRENLMIHGRIMGRSKAEALEHIPTIEAFAGIGDFINYPIKTYSTGMYMRLAFAAAIDMDPDVLIIDEALSVGDAKFQRKCYQKFEDFQSAGKTILFVSHSTQSVISHCDSAILLDEGHIVAEGATNDVANQYEGLLFGQYKAKNEVRENNLSHDDVRLAGDRNCDEVKDVVRRFIDRNVPDDACPQRPNYNKGETRIGDGRAQVVDYLIVAGDTIDPLKFTSNDTIDVYVKFHYLEGISDPTYGFVIKNVDGLVVYGNGSELLHREHDAVSAGEFRTVRFQVKLCLKPGDYFFATGTGSKESGDSVILDGRFDLVHVAIASYYYFDGVANLSMEMEEVS